MIYPTTVQYFNENIYIVESLTFDSKQFENQPIKKALSSKKIQIESEWDKGESMVLRLTCLKTPAVGSKP